ncbi:MAG: ribonuclease D [Pseudomonadota bacterium]
MTNYNIDLNKIIVIKNNDQLQKYCDILLNEKFIAIDTEFMRSSTYYASLCLIQIAGQDHNIIIDNINTALDLTILNPLLLSENVTKVFHSCRQDIEIFLHYNKIIPSKLFDTQIAAMACGCSESISYAKLAEKLLSVKIDKKIRYCDWSRRPLSKNQILYAIKDVTYLRQIYIKITNQLKKNNRETWITEEMSKLSDENYYHADIENLWKKIKCKSTDPEFLMQVRNMTKIREELAIKLNMPRNHVFKDYVILEIAASQPVTLKELKLTKGLHKKILNDVILTDILEKINIIYK